MIRHARTQKRAGDEEWIPTQCDMYDKLCGILVRREDGLVARIKR